MRRVDLHVTAEDSASFMEAVRGARVEDGLLLWSLGGSGVLLKSAQGLIVIDPYLSNRLGDLEPDAPPGWRDRSAPPPVRARDLKGLAAVMITHEHGDHFDPETLSELLKVNPQAAVIAPRSLSPGLLELGADERSLLHPRSGATQAMDGWAFEALPAAHVPQEAPALQADGHGGHHQLGYLVHSGGVSLYHAGDTVVYDGLLESLEGRVDACVLPINGRRWSPLQPHRRGNLDYEEAADLAALAGARWLVPVHHDLIGSSSRPIAPLLEYCSRVHPRLELLVLQAGAFASIPSARAG